MVELKGFLKVESTMDQNTFILTNSSGQYIGTLSISEKHVYDKLFKAFTDLDDDIDSKKDHIKPSIKMPISLVIKGRK